MIRLSAGHLVLHEDFKWFFLLLHRVSLAHTYLSLLHYNLCAIPLSLFLVYICFFRFLLISAFDSCSFSCHKVQINNHYITTSYYSTLIWQAYLSKAIYNKHNLQRNQMLDDDNNSFAITVFITIKATTGRTTYSSYSSLTLNTLPHRKSRNGGSQENVHRDIWHNNDWLLSKGQTLLCCG